jgi:hypothetical protein
MTENPTEALNAGLTAFADNLPKGTEAVAGFFFVADGKEIKLVHAVRNHRDKVKDDVMKARILTALDEFLRDKRKEWSRSKVVIEG